MEPSGCIATLASESIVGIVSLTQSYIREDEESYATISSRKWDFSELKLRISLLSLGLGLELGLGSDNFIPYS